MKFPEMAVSMLCTTLLFVQISLAQRIDFAPVNSGEVLSNVQEKNSAEAYDEAIKLLHTVPASDTNYHEVMYQLAYSHLLEERYDSAVWWARTGAKQFAEQRLRYLHLAASSLDYADSANAALAILDPLILEFPFAYQVKYSRVVVRLKLGNVQAAKEELIEILLMNPYHISSHYALGEIFYKEGNMVAAMLAFQTYLVLASEGRYTSEAIKYLSSMSTVTDEVTTLAQKADFSKMPAFGIIQQVLLSKASQNKKYQLKVSLDDPIVRQLQACNELLQYEPTNNDFVNQYYIPFYQEIFKRGDFDVMIYDMFASLNIDAVKTWNKKNEKRRAIYTDQVNEYMGLIRVSRELTLSKRRGSLPCYLWEDGIFTGAGPCTNGNLGEYYGSWKLYNDRGLLKSEGAFSANKKREGLWNFYHENGNLKEQTTYKAGNEEGKSEIWHNNGHPSFKLSYANGIQAGNEESYFYNGLLRNSSIYDNDEKNGPEKSYNFKGELVSEAMYVKGKLHGLYKSYHASGQLLDSINYDNGMANGLFVKYNVEGVVIEKGAYKNGMRHGLWTSWYKDGTTVREKTMYDNGDITGEFTEYFNNGVLSRKGSYVKKKPDGIIEDYDTDGKLYATITMDKGKVRQISYFDKQGNSTKTFNTTKGVSTVSFFDANGIKLSEGPYTRDGIKSGEFMYFYASGDISEKREMKDGMLNGISTGYYANGKKQYESQYKNDELNGYNIWYHTNGIKNSEGWYVDGYRQQYVSIYDERGQLTNLDYYLDNDEHGYHKTYYPNQQVQFAYKFHRGWLQEVWQYDSTGKVLGHYAFDKGEGPFEFKYSNGKVYSKGAYKHYALDGPYQRFFPDGQLISEINYNQSGLTGRAFWNFPHGKKWTTGNYSYGNKTGEWNDFFIDGKLKEKQFYADNELHGPDTLFRYDGSIENIENWEQGVREGACTYYDPQGILIIQLNYKKGQIISYTYLDANSKPKANIPVVNGNAMIKAMYPNGKESATIHLKNHKFQGVFRLMHSNGKPMIEAPFDGGYVDGTRFTYYPDGKVYCEEEFEAGSRFGKRNTYYPDGKPQLIEMFYHNDHHGPSKYFDANGKLIFSYFYYADIPEQKF